MASKCHGVLGGQVPRLYGGTIFRGGAVLKSGLSDFICLEGS